MLFVNRTRTSLITQSFFPTCFNSKPASMFKMMMMMSMMEVMMMTTVQVMMMMTMTTTTMTMTMMLKMMNPREITYA